MRIAVVDGWFSVIRQVTATCSHMRAHWRHLANTIKLVHPSAHSVHNRNGKWIGSAIFVQLATESAYNLQWAPLSTRTVPSHRGSGPPM